MKWQQIEDSEEIEKSGRITMKKVICPLFLLQLERSKRIMLIFRKHTYLYLCPF